MKKFVIQYVAYGIDTCAAVTVNINEREDFIFMAVIKNVDAVYQV